MVAVTMIFASCSKERKLNRKLDGEWSATSFSDAGVVTPVVAPWSITMKFGKDKKDNGTFSMTISDGTDSEVYSGTYKLSDDKSIVLTQTSPTPDMDVWTVTEYTKTKLSVTDAYGDTYEFKKK